MAEERPPRSHEQFVREDKGKLVKMFEKIRYNMVVPEQEQERRSGLDRRQAAQEAVKAHTARPDLAPRPRNQIGRAVDNQTHQIRQAQMAGQRQERPQEKEGKADNDLKLKGIFDKVAHKMFDPPNPNQLKSRGNRENNDRER